MVIYIMYPEAFRRRLLMMDLKIGFNDRFNLENDTDLLTCNSKDQLFKEFK